MKIGALGYMFKEEYNPKNPWNKARIRSIMYCIIPPMSFYFGATMGSH